MASAEEVENALSDVDSVLKNADKWKLANKADSLRKNCRQALGDLSEILCPSFIDQEHQRFCIPLDEPAAKELLQKVKERADRTLAFGVLSGKDVRSLNELFEKVTQLMETHFKGGGESGKNRVALPPSAYNGMRLLTEYDSLFLRDAEVALSCANNVIPGEVGRRKLSPFVDELSESVQLTPLSETNTCFKVSHVKYSDVEQLQWDRDDASQVAGSGLLLLGSFS